MHIDIQDGAPDGEDVAAAEEAARTLDSDARLAPVEIEGSTQDHILATQEKVERVHEDHVRPPKSEQIAQVKDDLNQDNNGDEEIGGLVDTRVCDRASAYPTSEDTGTEKWAALTD